MPTLSPAPTNQGLRTSDRHLTQLTIEQHCPFETELGVGFLSSFWESQYLPTKHHSSHTIPCQTPSTAEFSGLLPPLLLFSVSDSVLPSWR